MQLSLLDQTNSGAMLSTCRQYRYSLWRTWNPKLPTVVFIGLNPSTADENIDDPTIRRCQGFARSWEAGSIMMLNLFAFRSTSPQAMFRAIDPIGPDNDSYLLEQTQKPNRTIVAAWGNHGDYRQRDQHVLQLLKEHKIQLWCLEITHQGQPAHPLYLPKNSQRIPYPPIGTEG